jgi:hypothetical protein
MTHQSATQMTNSVIAARGREYATVVCPIAAFHMGSPAGSWSLNDHTTRKPGAPRLTSVLVT